MRLCVCVRIHIILNSNTESRQLLLLPLFSSNFSFIHSFIHSYNWPNLTILSATAADARPTSSSSSLSPSSSPLPPPPSSSSSTTHGTFIKSLKRKDFKLGKK